MDQQKPQTQIQPQPHQNKHQQSSSYYQKLMIVNNLQEYFQSHLYKCLSQNDLNNFNIIPQSEPSFQYFSTILQQMRAKQHFQPSLLKLTSVQNYGIATMLGLAICDALGASTEFQPFRKDYQPLILNGFADIKNLIKLKILDARAGRIGVWTDDCSMALSLADSILVKQYKLDPRHIRFMFTLWLQHGLNNGGRPYSIGLGGNISISMNQFMKRQNQYTQTGNQFNNGNGSLMRLAPIPLAYYKQQNLALQNAAKQSLTTHNGVQAKQCCRLLTKIIIKLITRENNCEINGKDIILKTCNEFQTKIKSVQYLAKGYIETQQMFQMNCKENRLFKKFNKSLKDRSWNWKDKNFSYSPFRLEDQPGYVGSYCMDALSMALHTVWYTNNFKELALMNANMGGDCDTVGAIAGQIGGALYGIDANMLKLYSQMVDCTSNKYSVFIKAYKLINHHPIVQQGQK